MIATDSGYCPAPRLTVLRVSGADARQFLHGQLTQDLRRVSAGSATPAAWLDAKGRVRACFDVVADRAGFALLAPTALAPVLVAKLGMFVLRADVVIAAEPTAGVFAVTGAAAGDLSTAGVSLGSAAHSHMGLDGCDWLRVGPGLVYGWGDPDTVAGRLESLDPIDETAAERAEIRLGRPQVDVATESRFVPQMLNLDLLGAVAFDKGCYPGQEIVARTHHLGAVKRRMYRFLADVAEPPGPGEPVVDAAGREVGTVIRSAPSSGGAELLAVVPVTAAGTELALAVAGAKLQRAELPYAIPPAG